MSLTMMLAGIRCSGLACYRFVIITAIPTSIRPAISTRLAIAAAAEIPRLEASPGPAIRHGRVFCDRSWMDASSAASTAWQRPQQAESAAGAEQRTRDEAESSKARTTHEETQTHGTKHDEWSGERQ